MSAVLTILIAGSIALQIPLGLAGERWRPRARADRLRSGRGMRQLHDARPRSARR
jgi:hypothetical protein